MASQTMKAFKTYAGNHSATQIPRPVFRLWALLCKFSDLHDPYKYKKGLALIQKEYPCKQRRAIDLFALLVEEGFGIKVSAGYGGKYSEYEFFMPDPCVPERGCKLVHTWSRQRVHSDTKEGALEDKEVCTPVPSSVHSLADNKPSINLSKSEVKSKATSPEELFSKVIALIPFGNKFYYDRNLKEEFTQLLTIEGLAIEALAWAIERNFKESERVKPNQLPITHLKEALKVILEAPQQVSEDFAKVQANKLKWERIEEERKEIKHYDPSAEIAELRKGLSVESRSSD